MPSYWWISEYFFMNPFFAEMKELKYSMVRKYWKLFVTENGYIYVVPMKSKEELMRAIKKFSKEVDTADALLTDAPPENKS